VRLAESCFTDSDRAVIFGDIIPISDISPGVLAIGSCWQFRLRLPLIFPGVRGIAMPRIEGKCRKKTPKTQETPKNGKKHPSIPTSRRSWMRLRLILPATFFPLDYSSGYSPSVLASRNRPILSRTLRIAIVSGPFRLIWCLLFYTGTREGWWHDGAGPCRGSS